jgi:phospholipid/cholesterol/gamma-HCH transport system substrate-binding protein
MAQRNQVSWAQLRVGLLVVVALTIFGLMTFLMTGQGYFSRKTTLVVFIDNAGGLKKGDPVRLTGIDVGNVQDITVSSDSDPKRAVEVSFTVESGMMRLVRQDSIATLEIEGLLGQRYIDLTRGTQAQPEIAQGGEVHFKDQPDFGSVMASSQTVLTNVNRLVNSFTKISEGVEKGQGSLGKLLVDDSLYKRADATVSDLQKMVTYANSGQGSLGKLVYSDEMYNHADGLLTKVDQTLDDVRSQKGSLGKFIYDDALHKDASKAVADFGTIVADVKAGKGSLGKLITDDALYNKATSTMDRTDSLLAGLQRGEGTLGKLMAKDDPVHGNVNNLTIELRQLIEDFRKNPKKFLTIQLKLF